MEGSLARNPAPPALGQRPPAAVAISEPGPPHSAAPCSAQALLPSPFLGSRSPVGHMLGTGTHVKDPLLWAGLLARHPSPLLSWARGKPVVQGQGRQSRLPTSRGMCPGWAPRGGGGGSGTAQGHVAASSQCMASWCDPETVEQELLFPTSRWQAEQVKGICLPQAHAGWQLGPSGTNHPHSSHWEPRS